MEITTSLFFPADPAAVFGLLTNQDFLADVARESGATQHTVHIQDTITISERTLDAPAAAHKFIGESLSISERRVWSSAQADGSRTAQLTLTSPGQPIEMQGTIALSPQRDGTRIDVRGDLKVRIPLVGKKLEKMAAPAVESGIRAEERVGLRWLAR